MSGLSWRHTRLLLALCAGLDLAGLLGLIVLNALIKSSSLDHQFGWLLFIACAYLALGWLFGSYTVLRWSRLPMKAAIQRVLITGMVTLLVVAMARLLINPPETIWVLHRSTQITLLMPLMVWSLGLRWVLRRGLFLPPAPRCLLVGQPEETKPVLEAFRRTPVRYRIRTMALEKAVQEPPPLLLVVAPSQLRTPDQLRLLDTLMARDPRDFSLTAPLTLLERVLERLPPALLPEPWLTYDDLPWNQMFSVPRQLKRVADVLIALLLLALLSPLIGCAALLIWLDDHGPVFYSQERSGHLGHPFRVFKLRTMRVSPEDVQPRWTSEADSRITRVGAWLRRLRLDELPQLLNVISGEMSLIGPRPERPEFEQLLEAQIPHYRKRHWMRPGLSGWAQVCAPYASSVEDSEIKLSYDLYYLKNFSTWLDMVILFRTIKTVLKAAGR